MAWKWRRASAARAQGVSRQGRWPRLTRQQDACSPTAAPWLLQHTTICPFAAASAPAGVAPHTAAQATNNHNYAPCSLILRLGCQQGGGEVGLLLLRPALVCCCGGTQAVRTALKEVDGRRTTTPLWEASCECWLEE